MSKKLQIPAGFGHRVVPVKSWLKTHPEDKELVKEWDPSATPRFLIIGPSGTIRDIAPTREEAKSRARHCAATEYATDRLYGLASDLEAKFGEDIDFGDVIDVTLETWAER